MKRFALLALLALLPGCGVATIPPGWEGIKVNNVGARRGTEDYPIQTGRVFFNPWTEDVYKYPISKQNYVWTASNGEGGSVDESITFNSVEGTPVTADVGIVFNVRPGMSPKLFVNYRQDIDKLIDGILRNEVRDALNREAGRAKIMEIIGPGRAALLDSVKADLRRGNLGEFLDFETISFVHALRPDPTVQGAINNVVTAMNNANAAEAIVRTRRAEAEQQMALARGDSASSVIRAKGRAEANALLRASLTSEIVEWEKLQKWNGQLPQVSTSGGVIVGLK